MDVSLSRCSQSWDQSRVYLFFLLFLVSLLHCTGGAGIKTKKKKCKKAKWLSEEALEIAVNRRETKGKGEKETYTHLNEEFQEIARRNKKAFLRDQCKKIEENNRMGKSRDLFKRIRHSKGTFHARWAQ